LVNFDFTPVDARTPNPKSSAAAEMVSWETIYNATAQTILWRGRDGKDQRALHNKFITQRWGRRERPTREEHILLGRAAHHLTN
jgi:hypothetical protein